MDTAEPILTAQEAVERRIEGIRRWLHDTAPECFDEQLHVVEGTPERVYWHYGYLAALRDLRALVIDKPEIKS